MPPDESTSAAVWVLDVCGLACHRDGKPFKTVAHSHADSLRRIAEASLLEDDVQMMAAPFAIIADSGQQSIEVSTRVKPLFELVQSNQWPAMMERYLRLEPGAYSAFKPSELGRVPPRRSRTTIQLPSTPPSNDSGPTICSNCQCADCIGPPCLSEVESHATSIQVEIHTSLHPNQMRCQGPSEYHKRRGHGL